MIPLHVVAQYLRVEDASQADLVEELERAAVAFVERETGRYFGPVQTVTETFSGVSGRRLLLRDKPTGTVTVTENGVATTDFTADGRVLLHTVTWSPYVDIRATYQRGYAEGQEPGDVRALVLQLTAHYYENRIGAPVPGDMQAALRRLRRLSV